MVSFVLAVLMILWLFYLRFCFLEYLRVQVSSRVPLFFLISVGSLWCASVFVLLGWSEFTFEALVGIFLSLCISESYFFFCCRNYIQSQMYCICFRCKYGAKFGSDADFARFPVVGAAPTPISLLEPSVYMWFHLLCLFSKISLKIFW